MTVRAITIDFWGTLLFDSPASDNRYKTRRMKDFETILAGAGVRVSASALDRAYEASGSYLGRIWARHRDVGVEDHVRAIVGAIDGDLAARLPADLLAALVDAYARPILAVEGARAAGMRVVQVTSASTSSVGGRRPDAVVPTLAALPDAIARLDR